MVEELEDEIDTVDHEVEKRMRPFQANELELEYMRESSHPQVQPSLTVPSHSATRMTSSSSYLGPISGVTTGL